MCKKNISITGSPVYPIVAGASAMIICSNGTTKTSRVVRVIEVTDDKIQFETLNSIYDLHITNQSPLSGMMVGQTFNMLYM